MSETVTIADVTVKAETELALLCVIDGDDVWIPRSQIDPDSDVKAEGDDGDLVITKWIAKKKGLL